MEGGVWGERDRRARGGGQGGEGRGAGGEISYQEQLAPSPDFWRVYKVSTGFANMQRDGVILVSFVNKFGVGVGLGGVGTCTNVAGAPFLDQICIFAVFYKSWADMQRLPEMILLARR